MTSRHHAKPRHHCEDRERTSKSLCLALLLLVLAVFVSTSASARQPYREGDPLSFHGTVRDAQGAAVEGVVVLLRPSRERFRLSRMGKEREDRLTLPSANLGPDGSYRIDWSWDPYYNAFELEVAIALRHQGRETFKVLLQRDVTETVNAGQPLRFDLVLSNSAELDSLRAFLASLDNEDAQRIYQEMGMPDRIEAPRAPLYESSWWYFAAGKSYHFKNGRLQQVAHFDPIPPAASATTPNP